MSERVGESVQVQYRGRKVKQAHLNLLLCKPLVVLDIASEVGRVAWRANGLDKDLCILGVMQILGPPALKFTPPTPTTSTLVQRRRRRGRRRRRRRGRRRRRRRRRRRNKKEGETGRMKEETKKERKKKTTKKEKKGEKEISNSIYTNSRSTAPRLLLLIFENPFFIFPVFVFFFFFFFFVFF